MLQRQRTSHKGCEIISQHMCRNSVARSRSFRCKCGFATPWSVRQMTELHYHKTIVSRYQPQCGHSALMSSSTSPLHMCGQICFVPRHFLRAPVISWKKAFRASSVDVHQTANKHTRGMLLPSHHPGPGTWYGRAARSQQKRHIQQQDLLEHATPSNTT